MFDIFDIASYVSLKVIFKYIFKSCNKDFTKEYNPQVVKNVQNFFFLYFIRISDVNNFSSPCYNS